jgi:hypothetical protein
MPDPGVIGGRGLKDHAPSWIYAPIPSIAGGFGNFLETITAHWRGLLRRIHHFFAAWAYS